MRGFHSLRVHDLCSLVRIQFLWSIRDFISMCSVRDSFSTDSPSVWFSVFGLGLFVV